MGRRFQQITPPTGKAKSEYFHKKMSSTPEIIQPILLAGEPFSVLCIIKMFRMSNYCTISFETIVEQLANLESNQYVPDELLQFLILQRLFANNIKMSIAFKDIS